MNNANKLTIALVAILGAGAAIGAYRSGLIGPQYAQVVKSTPITVTEPMYGEVLKSVPVTQTETSPQEVCSDKTVQVRQPERFGDKDGMVLGAVVGGLLGNQVGKGDGRKVATVAGAVGGAYAGREIDRRHEGGKLSTQTQRVCHTETREHTKTIGYDVSYSYDGQIMSKRLDEKPGEQILLGEREKVIGYDVDWKYRDRTGHVRLDHAPGERLPVRDGEVIASELPGSADQG